MPSFDDLEIQGTLQSGDLLPSTLKMPPSAGFQYNGNSLRRYKRVHWTKTKAIGSGGAVVSGPILVGVNGFPASITTAGATEHGFFMADFTVPVGAVLDTAWFLVESEASATESGRLDCYFYRCSPSGNTQLNAVAFAHNNATPTWYGVSLAYTDTRTRSDPTPSGEEFYIVRLEVQHDTVLGGTQTHYFWGFVLEYYIPSAAQLEEGT